MLLVLKKQALISENPCLRLPVLLAQLTGAMHRQVCPEIPLLVRHYDSAIVGQLLYKPELSFPVALTLCNATALFYAAQITQIAA